MHRGGCGESLNYFLLFSSNSQGKLVTSNLTSDKGSHSLWRHKPSSFYFLGLNCHIYKMRLLDQMVSSILKDLKCVISTENTGSPREKGGLPGQKYSLSERQVELMENCINQVGNFVSRKPVQIVLHELSTPSLCLPYNIGYRLYKDEHLCLFWSLTYLRMAPQHNVGSQ